MQHNMEWTKSSKIAEPPLKKAFSTIIFSPFCVSYPSMDRFHFIRFFFSFLKFCVICYCAVSVTCVVFWKFFQCQWGIWKKANRYYVICCIYSPMQRLGFVDFIHANRLAHFKGNMFEYGICLFILVHFCFSAVYLLFKLIVEILHRLH